MMMRNNKTVGEIWNKCIICICGSLFQVAQQLEFVSVSLLLLLNRVEPEN